MTTAPEWTYRHAESLRNHWWWRPGWQVGTRFYAWHLTFGDRSDVVSAEAAALRQLVERYQAALSTVAGLDLVPTEWLHLAMQGVGFAEDVHEEQVTAMRTDAQARLARFRPVKIRFHRPVIRREAIALPAMQVWPAWDDLGTQVEPMQYIHAAVRAATAGITNADDLPGPASADFQPHISIAYANAEQPAAHIQAALESVDTEPVDLIVRTVMLVEMHRDRRMYEWQPVRVPPVWLGHDA